MAPAGRRRLLITTALVLVVAAAVAGGSLVWSARQDDGADRARTAGPANTSRVVRQTLVSRVDLAGQLGYGASNPLASKATGTITWLPAAGRVISRGDTVVRVNNQPVVLLYGQLPMYRALGVTRASPSANPRPGATPAPGSTSAPQTSQAQVQPMRGPDVRQFERNLAGLGYSGFTVDDTFSVKTEEAVKRWQGDLGRPQTGRVELGDVIFQPGAVRVDHTLARLGADAGGDVIAITGTDRLVTADVQVADASWAVRGAGVSITLPDARKVNGSVTSVGTVAGSGQSSGGDVGGDSSGDSGQSGNPSGQSSTVPITIGLADQRTLGRITQGPVTVSYVSSQRQNVLTVPVASLLALSEGGYGLQLVQGSASRIVAVQVGMFSGGSVEVSGTGLAVNDVVGLPG